MKKKRILIVAPFGFNDRMAAFVEFSAGRLLARSGWEVTALVGADTGYTKTEVIAGITVVRSGVVQGILHTISIFIANRPSILHVFGLRNNRVGMFASLLARLIRIRTLHTEYGLLHDHYLTDFRDDPLGKAIHPERVIRNMRELTGMILKHPSRWRAAISSYIFHWPIAHADQLVFVSKHNLPIARELNFPPSCYLPYLVDDYRWQDTHTDTPGVEETSIREKMRNVSGIYVLFVGQMKLRKGWDVLLEAIAHTPPEDIRGLLFVSSSSVHEQKTFTEMVDRLGMRNRIIYLGKIPNNSLLREIYAASAIVAVPSRYEGFGLVPLEAFEMKKPVIASNVAALNEYLTDGKDALLVPAKNPTQLANALVTIARDAALQKRLVGGGIETLNNMRADSPKAWLAFYEEQLIANRPAS